MDIHNIHNEKIGFHSGASDAAHWLRDGLSEKGMKSYLDKARERGSYHFKDAEGRKFKIEHDLENGSFSIHSRH